MEKSWNIVEILERAVSSCTFQAGSVGALTAGGTTAGVSILGAPPWISIPLGIANGIYFGTRDYEQCVKARKFDNLQPSLRDLGTLSPIPPVGSNAGARQVAHG